MRLVGPVGASTVKAMAAVLANTFRVPTRVPILPSRVTSKYR
jgi:hypothetical protein